MEKEIIIKTGGRSFGKILEHKINKIKIRIAEIEEEKETLKKELKRLEKR